MAELRHLLGVTLAAVRRAAEVYGVLVGRGVSVEVDSLALRELIVPVAHGRLAAEAACAFAASPRALKACQKLPLGRQRELADGATLPVVTAAGRRPEKLTLREVADRGLVGRVIAGGWERTPEEQAKRLKPRDPAAGSPPAAVPVSTPAPLHVLPPLAGVPEAVADQMVARIDEELRKRGQRSPTVPAVSRTGSGVRVGAEVMPRKKKSPDDRPPGTEQRVEVESFAADADGNPVDADGRPVVLHHRPGCFTPPPWRARKTSLLSNSYLVVEDGRPHALVVASVRPRMPSTGMVVAEVTNDGSLLNRRPEHEANAYLIEQAPNLYAVVNNLLAAVETGEGMSADVADAHAVLAAVDRDRVGDLMAGVMARAANPDAVHEPTPEEQGVTAAVTDLDAARADEEKAEDGLAAAAVKLDAAKRKRRHAATVADAAEGRKALAERRRAGR